MKDKNRVDANNAFVKKEQSKQKGMYAKDVSVPKEMKKLNAYMSNDGDAAKRAVGALCKGLEGAYPCKK